MNDFIKLINVSKVFTMGDEHIVALNKINLSIKKGEFICLLGTSGSGKSTLLNMMAGLDKPSKGQIIINNKHIEKMSENQLALFRQKNIGFVFQSYNLIPTLTAVENVSLGLTFQGISKEKRNKMAISILKAVGLEHRLNHKPSEMSGGQQQRVSIARAFVNKPDIIFADEPTGNLDTKTTIEIMNLMTRIAKHNNQTLIIVTHDEEIAPYTNRVIQLRDGKIEKIKENILEEI